MVRRPRGGAKNSARRGCGYDLRFLRAGFEPCRARSCSKVFSLPKTLNRHESWALVKSTERLKTGAEMSQQLATRSERRVLRRTGFGGIHRVRGRTSHLGTRTRQKVATSPFKDDDEDDWEGSCP